MNIIQFVKKILSNRFYNLHTPFQQKGKTKNHPAIRLSYPEMIRDLLKHHPLDEAMSMAIGGDFDFMGEHLAKILQSYGLRAGDYLVDIGCGSGRLAYALTKTELCNSIRYLGTDVSEDLIQYAIKKCAMPSWRFETIDAISIPEKDDQADMICFFSVFTHLLPEESFVYLEEAKRVLKKNGIVLFSFLDFSESPHWNVFQQNIDSIKNHTPKTLDMFLSKDAISIWAEKLDMKIEYIGSPDSGQSRCIMRK